MKILVVLWIALTLSACAVTQQDEDDSYSAKIGIVNHTNQYIYATHVGDAGGGHSPRYSAGVANVCCVTLPVKWRSGLRFIVQWDMPEGTTHVWKEREVAVEEYVKPGSLYLHFFPNDEVRIVVTNWAGGAPGHPIPKPVSPTVQR